MEELTLLLIVLVFGLSLLYSKQIKDYLNPLLCFSCPILASFFTYYSFYAGELTLSNTTYAAYLMGILSFAIGFIVTDCLLAQSFFKRKSCFVYQTSSMLETIFVCLGVFSFLGGAYIFILRSFEQGIGGVFFTVRTLAVQGKYNNFFVYYGSVFLYVAAMWFFYRLKIQNETSVKVKTWLLLFCLFATTIFSLAKTDFLINFLACFYIYYLGSNNSLYKTYRPRLQYGFIFLLLLFCFFLISWARGALIQEGMDAKDFFVFKYLGYSLVTFERYVVGHPGIDYGYNSLGGLGKLLRMLGVFDPKGVDLPANTEYNVFSFLFDPYLDFGLIGCVVVMVIIGIFSSLVFRLSRRYAGFYTIFYASYLYALTMAFFDYQFANTQFVWIALLLSILSFFSKKYYFIRNDVWLKPR